MGWKVLHPKAHCKYISDISLEGKEEDRLFKLSSKVIRSFPYSSTELHFYHLTFGLRLDESHHV